MAALYPLRKVGQPENVAKAIAFLASSESSFSTGTLFPLDGGSHLNVRLTAEIDTKEVVSSKKYDYPLK